MVEGTELEAWKAFREQNGEYEDTRLKDTNALYYYFYSIEQGNVGISTFKKISEEQLNILKRFRNVFDLAYKRYVDISNAEAQAKEARIEAGLERVRSRSMAMHHTSELQEVIHTVHKELLHLNIAINGGSFIAINDDIKTTLRCWGSGGTADTSAEVHLPLYEKPFCSNLIKGIKNGPGFFTEEYSQEDKKEFFTFLFEYEPWSALDAEQKKETLLSPGGYTRSCCVSKHTSIFIINHFGEKFSASDNEILKRFGKVFDQTYTRFLDLQKAEAQAREAQIEAALERVRSRTMAMQHSDELAEASFVLDSQIRSLGIQTRGCAFNIYRDNESTEWFSSEMGTMPTYKTPRENIFLRYYEAGKAGAIMHIEAFEGDACAAHYNYLCTLPVMGDALKEMIANGGSFPVRQTDHVVYFKYGYLLFITYDPVPESHEIFIRFTKVFEQTYTRFLDLQKAEAQAIRAEQDLIAIKEAKQKAEEAFMELQATQKQLIQSEKMASLGELTAGIAHEIQNPLNFVNNFSDLSGELIDEMNEELNKGDIEEAKAIAIDVKQNLEKINHHGKRADAIVKGMLQHSRSSSATKEPTGINKLADEYLRLAYHARLNAGGGQGLRAKDNAFNALLKTDFDATIGNINIIPQDIGRVLLNLFNNAFYAITEKQKTAGSDYQPTVSISTKNNGHTIELTVSDNGNGIPAAIKEKIFQPFFTTKPTGQGTGLGLSLSYDIVKAHGGEIRVVTEKDKGTQFIVQLPI
jgi:signal transduction histidine kinase